MCFKKILGRIMLQYPGMKIGLSWHWAAEPRPVWGRRGRDKERGRKLNFLLSTGL